VSQWWVAPAFGVGGMTPDRLLTSNAGNLTWAARSTADCKYVGCMVLGHLSRFLSGFAMSAAGWLAWLSFSAGRLPIFHISGS